MANIDIFNKMAAKYDTPERIQVAQAIAKEIRKHALDATAKKAIDYGCGTGLVGLQLLEDFQSIYFIDGSEQMIHQLNLKLAQAQTSNAETLVADLTMQSIPDLQADYIILAQTLLHVPEVELLLSRMYDIINPQGHLLIIDFDENQAVTVANVHPGFNQGKLQFAAEQAGFTNITSQIFFSAEHLFMNQPASLFLMDAMKQ